MQTESPSHESLPPDDAAAAEAARRADAAADGNLIDAGTAAADALDLVDEALAALEADDLERAEELSERLESPARPAGD